MVAASGCSDVKLRAYCCLTSAAMHSTEWYGIGADREAEEEAGGAAAGPPGAAGGHEPH